jgi:ubiquinone/menaquinone biosynthesis C-methylase UbiE
MSFEANMFNRKASDLRNKPDQILEALALQRGQFVADIGSGGGYFSLRFAKAVGKEGWVYALDTNKKMLEFVRKSAKEKGMDNVETLFVEGDDLPLPEKGLNLIFMRNVCHHLPNRVEYFKKVKDLLKPEGTIAILEYRRSARGLFRRIFGHYISKEVIVNEMNEAGYQIKETFDFLPDQSFNIFTV